MQGRARRGRARSGGRKGREKERAEGRASYGAAQDTRQGSERGTEKGDGEDRAGASERPLTVGRTARGRGRNVRGECSRRGRLLLGE